VIEINIAGVVDFADQINPFSFVTSHALAK
jgi:hypothetical protein